ncbi:glycosyltransferase family 4 protein [bacterium]|nr:glycosyltransferase family 4 protein [bacterium]
MRIVFATDWYSEGMGYSENILPAVLARMGHDVFVVSSTMQVYGNCDFYADTYEQFLGPAIVEPGTKVINGVTVIRLPIQVWWKRFKVAKAKTRTVLGLKPDIVYSWDPRSLQTLLLSMTAWTSKYKLFSSVHTLASVYPAYYRYKTMPLLQRLRLRLVDTLIGWLASQRIDVCYACAPDAAEIAIKFFGVRFDTVKYIVLGFDITHFHPVRTIEDHTDRNRIRASLQIASDEIVCIYTGRFTVDKNPKCLADAIGILRASGHKYRAIFLGKGEQTADIAAVDGCKILPFVKHEKLPLYYRAIDIGVWPREESISMLDATACGIPIVASDRMLARDRIDGNGLSYRENDPADLASVLIQLGDSGLRKRLGTHGVEKVAAQFDIETVATEIVADFQQVLDGLPVTNTGLTGA